MERGRFLRRTLWLPAILILLDPSGGRQRARALEESGGDLETLRRLNRPTGVDRAVDRGIEFLLKSQFPDGSFGSASKNALTSLAVMALLSRGHLPGASEEGQAVSRALDYLVGGERQREDGYFGADGSRMYGHGITTLLLAEVLGMGVSRDQEERILAACRKGIDLILRAQAVPKDRGYGGGWRYTPDDRTSDLSVTVWQVMALRAARNAGMEVPGGAIERAVAYVRRCFRPSDRGFSYQQEDRATPGMTGAGILSLKVCGVHEGRELRASGDALLARPVDWTDGWFYYGIYYYAQAMHQLGGRHAGEAAKRVGELLLSRQSGDGSWPPPPRSSQERKAGRTYRTALSILALSVEYRFLPIYQR